MRRSSTVCSSRACGFDCGPNDRSSRRSGARSPASAWLWRAKAALRHRRPRSICLGAPRVSTAARPRSRPSSRFRRGLRTRALRRTANRGARRRRRWSTSRPRPVCRQPRPNCGFNASTPAPVQNETRAGALWRPSTGRRRMALPAGRLKCRTPERRRQGPLAKEPQIREKDV